MTNGVAMGKSQKLRESEIRAVMRLLSDVREMRHDRPAMHRLLVETMTRLVNATGGFAADVDGWLPQNQTTTRRGRLKIESFTPSEMGFDIVGVVMRGLAANNNLWDDPTFAAGVNLNGKVESVPFHQLVSNATLNKSFPLFSQVKSESGYVDHLVSWCQKLDAATHAAADAATSASDGPGRVFGLSLHRYGKTEKLFSGREAALARFLFEELRWLHVTGRLQPPIDGYDRLSPRLREVVTLLLAGLAPKQIASHLGLSVHTVRDHIKRIYEQLDVNGREELTAKFVRMNKPLDDAPASKPA
jgi:DNA-binding CsgD family transcriptional regulator